MSLARLLFELRPLLDDPNASFDRIVQLLDDHQEMAEYEVARFYAAKAVGKEASERLGSIDPRDRKRAIQAIAMVFPRSDAARLLRRVVKDPDPAVRAHARHAVRKLGISDVALPDTRIELNPHARITSTTPGAYNPTGWAFGTLLWCRVHPTRADRLRRHGLPELSGAKDVAELVGVGDEELSALTRPGTIAGAPYVVFEIEKASGGKRRITAPKARLKRVQQIILEQILAKVPVHEAAHGFVPGRSTVTNAAPHQRARVVVKMDLVDFFPSIHYRRVVGLFNELGYGERASIALAGLCTHRPLLKDGRVAWPGVLPQGAPTSPAITNLTCRRLDARLAGLADKSGARYTRYADDMTFSFERDPEVSIGRLCWWIDQICQQEGFLENVKKRRVLRSGNQQRVTGIVVNSGLFVPRAERRRFRAILHNVRRNGVAAEARGRPDFEGYLRGFAAYVRMVQPALGERLVREVEEALA